MIEIGPHNEQRRKFDSLLLGVLVNSHVAVWLTGYRSRDGRLMEPEQVDQTHQRIHPYSAKVPRCVEYSTIYLDLQRIEL